MNQTNPQPGLDWSAYPRRGQLCCQPARHWKIEADEQLLMLTTFAHNQAALDLDFTALGLQHISNESWDLDNITVRCIIPATNRGGEE